MVKNGLLGEFNKLFTPFLIDFFDKKKKEAEELPPIISEAIGQIESLTLSGGKRIRPALVYYTYQAFTKSVSHDRRSVRMHSPGVEEFKAIRNYCLSIELLHSWALIHDDIMDRASLRRGSPTVNVYYQKKYKDQNLANSLSILTGDLSLSYADELFYFSRHPEFISGSQSKKMLNQVQHDILQIYSRLKNEVIYGQILDITKVQKESDILEMMHLKTASYSIEKPLLIGAVLGGATPKQLKTLSEFGKKVGLAFQIQDDILGVFGSSRVLGKSVVSDMKEGKMNLLAVKTLQGLPAREKKEFFTLWGNANGSEKELLRTRELVKKSNAYQQCVKIYNLLKKESLKIGQMNVFPAKLPKILSGIVHEILILEKEA